MLSQPLRGRRHQAVISKHFHFWPFWPKVAARVWGCSTMQILAAKDAKYNFGRLIDIARAEPVTVEKHGRAVVVVLAVEEYERLKAIEAGQNG